VTRVEGPGRWSRTAAGSSRSWPDPGGSRRSLGRGGAGAGLSLGTRNEQTSRSPDSRVGQDLGGKPRVTSRRQQAQPAAGSPVAGRADGGRGREPASRWQEHLSAMGNGGACLPFPAPLNRHRVRVRRLPVFEQRRQHGARTEQGPDRPGHRADVHRLLSDQEREPDPGDQPGRAHRG
jgi:hypothetical protein